MVSYQPIRLNFEDLPNDFMIKTIAVVGNGLTALEKKKMALCGGKNQWGEVCRLPVFYSKDMSLRDVVCGMCGCEINWGDFISYVNFCPECKEERDSTLQFCTRHLPPFDCRNKRSHSRLCTLQLLLFTNKIKF